MAIDGDLQTLPFEMACGKDSAATDTTPNPEASFHYRYPPTVSANGTHPPPTTKDTSLTTSGSPENPTVTTLDPTTPSAPDPLSPTLWPRRLKLTQTTLCILVTFLTGWNATALTAATTATNIHFHISDTHFPHSVWALTAWNLGAAIAPMFILPVMEDYGTRPGYLSVYALFVCLVIPQPLLGSYAAFCGVRFLAGCCAGVLQTCMDGVIADVWADSTEMSRPVSCYVAALLAGVSSGPVMGGVVCGAWGLGWRWVLWLQVVLYVVMGGPVWWCFGETRVEVLRGRVERKEGVDVVEGMGDAVVEEAGITTQHPPQPEGDTHSHAHSHPHPHTKSSLITFLLHNILRPFHLLLTEPVVFTFTLLSALSYGITFLSTQSIPQVYAAVYNFTEPETAYIQSAIVLGESVGWAICMWIQDPFFARCANKAAAADADGRKLRRILPEKRLYAAVPASFLALAAGLFIYGFSAQSTISLYIPTFGLFLVGVGVVVVMQAIMMYVTDSYGIYAASASAAVCFGENVFAALLPLGAKGMYDTLGDGWAGGLLGGVALLLGLGPVVLVWRGEWVRGRSRFMVTGRGEVGVG